MLPLPLIHVASQRDKKTNPAFVRKAEKQALCTRGVLLYLSVRFYSNHIFPQHGLCSYTDPRFFLQIKKLVCAPGLVSPMQSHADGFSGHRYSVGWLGKVTSVQCAILFYPKCLILTQERLPLSKEGPPTADNATENESCALFLAAGLTPPTTATFVEEAVRGGAGAPLSQMLAVLEPWWVSHTFKTLAFHHISHQHPIPYLLPVCGAIVLSIHHG